MGRKEDYEIDTPSIDIEPHLLITSTRKKYLEFIFKLLSQNYTRWCEGIPPSAVFIAAKKIELETAARAMVVSLYTKEILSVIEKIKKFSNKREIYPFLHNTCISVENNEKSTQTDESVFFDNNTLNKTHIQNSNCENIPKNIITEKADFNHDEFNMSNCDEDQILKNMEELFKDDTTPNFDLFDNTNDERMMTILHEIENHKKNQFDSSITDNPLSDENFVVENNSTHNKQNIVCKDRDNFVNGCGESNNSTTVNNNSLIVNNSIHDTQNNTLVSKKIGSKNVATPQYVYSKWPCEEYFQKKILCEKLDDISEKSYRLHKKVKSRFVDIFGVPSEDEQAIQSPNTSIDFLRSCRQRISPYVTHHMKPYVVRYKIPTELFRPLARHLIYKLIEKNQYPGDYETYKFIKEYFKYHRRIKNQSHF